MSLASNDFAAAASQLARSASLAPATAADACYLHLINSNIFGVGVADISGRIVQANDYVLALTRMTRDDVATGQYQWQDLIAPGYEEVSRNAIACLQEHGVCPPFESALASTMARSFPCWSTWYWCPNRPESFVVLVIDLSQQKQAETQWCASDARFSRLLEKLPAAAYTCDRDGLISCYNDQAVELWGRAPRLNDPADRYCGSYKLSAADGTPIRHDECWMAKTLQENREFHGREVTIESADGRLRHGAGLLQPFPRRAWSSDRSGQRAGRHFRAESPGRPAPSIAKDGGRRPAGRRRGARFQQHADGDSQLHRAGGRAVARRRSAAQRHGYDQRRGQAGRRPDASATGVGPPYRAGAETPQPQRGRQGHRAFVGAYHRGRHRAVHAPGSGTCATS